MSGRFAGARGQMLSAVRWYGTRFQSDEDPISEGAMWLNGREVGIDWADVVVRDGVAYGAVTRLGEDGYRAEHGHVVSEVGRTPIPTGDFDDPVALVGGTWGPDQYAGAVVYSRNPTEQYRQEIELRLRSTIARHLCNGYEILWRCLKSERAYAEIVRWNGPPGDFTVLERRIGAETGVSHGDRVAATVIGSTIKGFVNGVEVISTADDAYADGRPGIGFNSGVGATNVDHGVSYFEVESYRE